MRPLHLGLSSSSSSMGNSVAASSSDGYPAGAAPPPSMTAKPRSTDSCSDGSAAAAPPSLTAKPRSDSSSDGYAAAGAPTPPSLTAKPRSSSSSDGGAATPPSLTAKPRSTESSSDGPVVAAPPACTTSLAGSEAGETTKQPEYPRRPGVADCSYYAKFGTCGYGMKCWFNHPPPPQLTQASSPSGSTPTPSSSHRAKHQDFSEKARNNNYNRHEGKIKAEQVKTNFLGLPLRPGAGLCSYYMQRGTCKFGTNCKYHHPDPKLEDANSKASCHVVEGSAQPKFPSKPVQRAKSERSVSLVTPPTSGTSEIIPTRHVVEDSSQLKFPSKSIQQAKNERSVSLVTPPTSGTSEIIPTCHVVEDSSQLKFPSKSIQQAKNERSVSLVTLVEESSQLKFPSKSIQRAKNEHSVSLVTPPTSGTSEIIPTYHVVEESSQPNFSSKSIQRANNERFVSLLTPPTSGTSEIIATQGDSTCTEQSAHMIVPVSKDILELKRDIDAELAPKDSNVQDQSCNHYDGSDRPEWLSGSAQIPVVSEEKSWDNIYESQGFYASSRKQEKLYKHGQLRSQLDSNTQVYIPWSIQGGNLNDREGVIMAVKGILENLTPDKFDLVKDHLIEAGTTRDDILEDVITIMFDKAVSVPTFCPMYAQLCSYLNKKLPSSPPEEPDGEEIAFTSVLLNNCHEVFETAGNLCAKIDRLAGLDQEKEVRSKEVMLMKLRTVGNIRLIGEMLKQKIVIEKIAHHTVQMDENKQGSPDWDTFATKVFCDICTAEVLAGNRSTDNLNDIGYNNLYTKFNDKTKKGYNHEQFKSKWESLRQEYQTWKTLMESEDDLGKDPGMKTISASPEWWARKMEAMPDCSKFRSAPLENVDLLNIMFEDMLDSSSATPEDNLAVNIAMESKHGAGVGKDIGIIDKDVNKKSKEAVLQKVPKEEPNSTKPKKNRMRAKHNHHVNLDENVNQRNSATSMRVDQVGRNISEIMELVVDAGVKEGSDEHFIATQLFIRPEYREMFLTLKTPQGRLGWLKKMGQVKE